MIHDTITVDVLSASPRTVAVCRECQAMGRELREVDCQ